MPAAAAARGPKCFMFDRGRAPRVLVRLAFPERGSHSIVSPGTSAVDVAPGISRLRVLRVAATAPGRATELLTPRFEI